MPNKPSYFCKISSPEFVIGENNTEKLMQNKKEEIAAKKHHSKYFILAENVSDDNTLTTPQRFKPSIPELSTTLDTNSPSTSEEKLVIDENPATKSIQVLVCRSRCKLSRYFALKIKQTLFEFYKVYHILCP